MAVAEDSGLKTQSTAMIKQNYYFRSRPEKNRKPTSASTGYLYRFLLAPNFLSATANSIFTLHKVLWTQSVLPPTTAMTWQLNSYCQRMFIRWSWMRLLITFINSINKQHPWLLLFLVLQRDTFCWGNRTTLSLRFYQNPVESFFTTGNGSLTVLRLLQLTRLHWALLQVTYLFQFEANKRAINTLLQELNRQGHLFHFWRQFVINWLLIWKYPVTYFSKQTSNRLHFVLWPSSS